MCSGKPRYLPGNEETFPGKSIKALDIMSSVHLIGNIYVLFMLTFSPEHLAKTCNSWPMRLNSSWSGFAKRAASSAYREHLNFAAFGRTW